MKKYPKCGRYMSSHLRSEWGMVFIVWVCPCGYVTETRDGEVHWSDKTEMRRENGRINYLRN